MIPFGFWKLDGARAMIDEAARDELPYRTRQAAVRPRRDCRLSFLQSPAEPYHYSRQFSCSTCSLIARSLTNGVETVSW